MPISLLCPPRVARTEILELADYPPEISASCRGLTVRGRRLACSTPLAAVDPKYDPKMATISVAVLGAGVSGLAAALALGRAGHAVTLIERDEVTAGEALDAVSWRRPGIPHFLQAHARSRREGGVELRALFSTYTGPCSTPAPTTSTYGQRFAGPLRPQ